MLDIKNFIGISAVILSFIGYIPYFIDIFRGKTKPHIYSWLIWSLLTALIFGMQFSNGAGPGSWVTLTVTIIGFSIFFLGLKNDGKDITKIDTIFLILSLISILLWLVAKQPILSTILAIVIEMLGFIPTVRKSWNNPFSETLFTYELGSLRHGLSIFALQNYNVLTWLYPATWVLANGLFSLMLIYRRGQIR